MGEFHRLTFHLKWPDSLPGRSGLLPALPLVDLRKLWDSNAHNLMLVEEFPHGFADRKLKFQQRNDITLSHCTFVVASRGVSGPHLGRRGKVFIENQTHHPAKLLFPISKLRGSYTHATPMTQWGSAGTMMLSWLKMNCSWRDSHPTFGKKSMHASQ